jgi:hypothetical protein
MQTPSRVFEAAGRFGHGVKMAIGHIKLFESVVQSTIGETSRQHAECLESALVELARLQDGAAKLADQISQALAVLESQ